MLWLAGSLLGSAATPAADPPKAATAAGSVAGRRRRNPRTSPECPTSGRNYYAIAWGVDQLSAKLVESGQLVRFSYRVVDAAKAAALHDKASAPYMLDEAAHAVLQIPEMEKVGKLRQSGPPENGRKYWMAFSNKGNYVKAGHRVSVVIGQVRVDGLVVQP